MLWHGVRMGVPPPLSHPRCSVGLWAVPTPLPVLLYPCSCSVLAESSLEEELNRVRGGMLVMPDLLFGVSFLGGTSLWGEMCPG